MAETKTAEKKTDWLVPVAIALGAAGTGLGIFLFMRKPPGVDPGDKVRAQFTFEYLGDGGSYILLVRFGYHRVSGLYDWFDPEEGMNQYTRSVSLPGPDAYEFDVDCVIPDGASARSYDAEASILTPDSQPGQDWILRVFKDKAITVRKD